MGEKVSQIRSLALIAHGGSGKTSLAEAMLFNSGVTNRLGKVDQGSAVMDFEPEELRRQVSISASFHHLPWKKHILHIVDTPGDVNFLTDTKLVLQGVDSAVLLVDATDGVKVTTEKVWAFADELQLPRAVFVNKIERERADFEQVLDRLNQTFSVKCVPMTLPIGQEHAFKGVVDLFRMKAYIYQEDESGKFDTTDIPQEMADRAQEMRESLIEFIAESDDELLEKYLEGQELSKEDLQHGLKTGVKEMKFVPVFVGSATRNMGVQPLLDALVDCFPSPQDRPSIKGKNPISGEEIMRPADETAPFSGLVIKTISDPYAGKLNVIRIFSGTLEADSSFYNVSKEQREKFGQLFFMEGKNQSSIESAGPGEIVAIAKLKVTSTGDTVSDENHPVLYQAVSPLPASIAYALAAKNKGDEEKVFSGILKLTEEDPTLRLERDKRTYEILLYGTGQIHLEVAIEKLKRKYGVEAALKPPKIPYLETVTREKKGVVYRHKKQSGGRGQFAEVHFDIYPKPRGEGYEFDEALVGMNVPRNFVPAVEKGIDEAKEKGVLAGYPVVDFRIRFYDGKSHEVDSSEMAFKIAASMCFKKAVQEANPILLEPIMKMEVTVPDEYMGDVIGDLNGRRGRVLGMKSEGSNQVITAHVAMSEVLRYQPDLTSITGGRGSFTMEMDHYEPMPLPLQEKVIAEVKEPAEES